MQCSRHIKLRYFRLSEKCILGINETYLLQLLPKFGHIIRQKLVLVLLYYCKIYHDEIDVQLNQLDKKN